MRRMYQPRFSNVSTPNHAFHPNPPLTTDALHACIERSSQLLGEDKRWHPDFLALHFRTLCLPTTLVDKGLNAVREVIDTASMQPLDRTATPDLARIMDFATRASVASLVLYRKRPDYLNPILAQELGLACAYYRGYIIKLVKNDDVHHTVTDLRFLASLCTIRPDASAPHRDWEALLADDIRWCLVADAREWPGLILAYPQTAPYLELFAVLKQLVSPGEAMRQLWYPSSPNEAVELPDLSA